MPRPTRVLLVRFCEQRKLAEQTENGCLLWRATLPNGSGYAEVRCRNDDGTTSRSYAHRLAWVDAFGEIPPLHGVFHHCDTPLCIEPSHLFCGPQSENVRDAVRKGRHATSGLQRRGAWDSCRKGHPLFGDNLIKKKGGGRECRACRQERDRRNRRLRVARASAYSLSNDVLYPRDEEHRFRVYARRGKDELEVLACAGSPEALGLALVTLDEDEKERGRRLIDLGAIGVLDAVARRWIVMPWHRPEERTRLRNLEVEL